MYWLIFAAWCSLPWPARAADRWREYRSGPFQVATNSGARAAQDALCQLEQLRHLLGVALGKPEMRSVWPIRITISKTEKQAVPLAARRDAITGVLPADRPVPAGWMRECARILIEANAGRMPAPIETGLADFYSTLEANGSRVTTGKPVPEAERTPAWALVHLLSVDPAYSGKLRVLLANLQQGIDPEPSYKNAFGRTPAEIEKEAAAYLAAGRFQTLTFSGRPLNPRKDFPAVAASAAPADGERGPMEWLEAGRVSKSMDALRKAADMNPRWAEPYRWMAEFETDTVKKIQYLKAAATLDPRSASVWQRLAEAQMKANAFDDAVKSWAAAEHASIDDGERARIRAARASIDQKRLDIQAAERKRQAGERERGARRAKETAMAEVRAAEQRANRDTPPGLLERAVEQWWQGQLPTAKATGRLTQVDCRGGIRLTIQTAPRKFTRLAIRDPQKIVVIGGGQLDLVCGPQRRPKPVVLEYFPKADSKLATAGDVATIEYQ